MCSVIIRVTFRGARLTLRPVCSARSRPSAIRCPESAKPSTILANICFFRSGCSGGFRCPPPAIRWPESAKPSTILANICFFRSGCSGVFRCPQRARSSGVTNPNICSSSSRLGSPLNPMISAPYSLLRSFLLGVSIGDGELHAGVEIDDFAVLDLGVVLAIDRTPPGGALLPATATLFCPLPRERIEQTFLQRRRNQVHERRLSFMQLRPLHWRLLGDQRLPLGVHPLRANESVVARAARRCGVRLRDHAGELDLLPAFGGRRRSGLLHDVLVQRIGGDRLLETAYVRRREHQVLLRVRHPHSLHLLAHREHELRPLIHRVIGEQHAL